MIRAHHRALGLKRRLGKRRALANRARDCTQVSRAGRRPGSLGLVLTLGQAHDVRGLAPLFQMIGDHKATRSSPAAAMTVISAKGNRRIPLRSQGSWSDPPRLVLSLIRIALLHRLTGEPSSRPAVVYAPAVVLPSRHRRRGRFPSRRAIGRHGVPTRGSLPQVFRLAAHRTPRALAGRSAAQERRNCQGRMGRPARQ